MGGQVGDALPLTNLRLCIERELGLGQGFDATV
jgi:hypothetical protein